MSSLILVFTFILTIIPPLLALEEMLDKYYTQDKD